MKLSDAATRVSDLGSKIYDYYTSELPKYYRNYPLVSPGEEGAPPPPEENELRQFLETLPADMVYRLALIMYLGREDFRTDDLADKYENAESTFGDSEYLRSVMVAHSPLVSYLSDGLEELHKHGIDVDALPLNGVVVQKR